MKAIKVLALAGAVALVAALGASSAQAGFGRQYYGGWHHSHQGYWYCNYYYTPYAGYPSYCYNYAIWYPATPKFAYYYNPYKGTYWGRFDFQTKGYSLLAEKDRTGQLKDIPEKAFPAEGALPQVPDAKDQLTLKEPPDLPGGEKLNTAAGAADAPPDVVTPAETKPEVAPVDLKKDDATPPVAPVVPAGGAGGAAPATPAVGTGGAAPVAPIDGAAPVTPAAPVGGAAPVGPTDGPVTPPPAGGTGVVAPVEPVTPAPVGGGVAPVGGGVAPVGGGGPAPVGGGVAPVTAPVIPGCHKQYGGWHGYGYRPGYGW